MSHGAYWVRRMVRHMLDVSPSFDVWAMRRGSLDYGVAVAAVAAAAAVAVGW
jgi:hypothetical protein